MANWILFNDTGTNPAARLINIDTGLLIQAGTVAGTLSIGGVLVKGDIARLALMINAVEYPGFVHSAFTSA